VISRAMGAATSALLINLSRQGIIYIPSLFILSSFLGADGLAWAQPVADVLSDIMVCILYFMTLKRMRNTKKPAELQV
jgi:multidrug efflux pump